MKAVMGVDTPHALRLFCLMQTAYMVSTDYIQMFTIYIFSSYMPAEYH